MTRREQEMVSRLIKMAIEPMGRRRFWAGALAGMAGVLAAPGVLAQGPKPAGGSSAIQPVFRPRASYSPGERTTVCLVHGLNSSSGGFAHMVPALETAGYGVVLYDYPDTRGLEQSTREFEAAWAAFRDSRPDRSQWVLLGHSMGCLLARHYVEGPAYRHDVSDLVLIAPPNRGSYAADFQGIVEMVQSVQAVGNPRFEQWLASRRQEGLAAARDLRPGSAFLRELADLPRRSSVRYFVLAGNAGFLTRADRQMVEGRFQQVARGSQVLGSLALLAVGNLEGRLDELSDGTGDGCVAVSSTRLAGVIEHRTIRANHVELIRGPLMYPEPGPVAAMPHVLQWLGRSPEPIERAGP